MKQILAITLALFLSALPTLTFAQSVKPSGQVRRNIATVLIAGLGGAAIGGATLAFYSKPQDQIGNIWLGLAAGLIGGTIYVMSHQPDEKPSILGLSPAERQLQTLQIAKIDIKPTTAMPLYQMSFEF